MPVWTNLGNRFYTKLNRLARKHELSRAELLEEALSAFEKSKKTMPLKKAATTEDAVRKTFGSYAKTWWASLSPEDREIESKKRSEAAKIRWKKERA